MASANLGKWSAQATIDASGMQKGAAQAIQSAKGMESALEGIFGRMGAALKFPGFSLGFENIGTGLGLQAVRTAFNVVKETAEQAEAFGFLNDNLGTSVEFLSSFRTMAEEAGVGTEKFTTAMNRLNQSVGRANQGEESVLRMFRDVGVSAEELQAGNMDAIIQRVMAGLAGIEDRSIRARIATEIFGREGGAQMLRLATSSERFNASLADVARRGGLVTQEELDRIRHVDELLDKIATSMGRVKRGFTGMVGDIVKRLEDLAGITALNELEAAIVAAVPTPQQQLADIAEMDEEAVRRLEERFGPNWQQVLGLGAQAVDEFSMSLENNRARVEELNRAVTDADRFTEQARSPLMIYQDTVARLNELFQDGTIDARTFGRGLEQAFERTGLSGPSPLLGSLSAGGSDTEAILQAAMSPQVDPLLAMQATLEAMAEADQENNELLERLVDWFENGPGAQLAGAIEA